MEKKNRIRQDTVYDDSIKRLGHCWGWSLLGLVALKVIELMPDSNNAVGTAQQFRGKN